MVYCLNPSCLQPQNPDSAQFCNNCGAALLLKERYQAMQTLGQGGFGRTFLGRDRHRPTHPSCVIKQLYLQNATPGMQAKAIALFQQEAMHLQELGTHPQIPTLLAHFEQDGQLFLVQEFVEGPTLNPQMWQQGGDLEAKTWQLLKDLLPILHFVHDRKVIHRDIKPENIIQRRSDAKFVLIDFGVSRLLTNTALMGGATIVGTPGFMAVEQMHGKVLPASDLYSLGVTCVHLLTGTEPDRLYDAIAERWVWREHLPPNTKISPQLSKILNQLLQPSLRQRSQSAAAVLREMGVALPEIESSAIAPTAIVPIPPPSPTQLPSAANAVPLRPQPTIQQPGETVKIDYTPLKTLLLRKRWKEADDETWSIFCRLLGKRAGAYLSNGDIERLPCADLKAIDFLWFKSSNGRFGFGVQKQIYTEVGGEYDLFCDRVGWTTHRPIAEEKNLKFTLRAPAGHLPSRRWIGSPNWWKHASTMSQKLTQCGWRSP
jgi:serine/threonine protein kinase